MGERERVESVMDVIEDLDSSDKPNDKLVARIYKELFFTEGKILGFQLEGSPITVQNPGGMNALAVSGCPDYDLDNTLSHFVAFGQVSDEEKEGERRKKKLKDAIYSVHHVPVEILIANAQKVVERLRAEGLITLGAVLLGNTFSAPGRDSVQILYPRVFKESSPTEDKTQFAVSMASLFLSGVLNK